MTMGLPPKILFGFELDDANAWSQVSPPVAGPRTNSTYSTAVTELMISGRSSFSSLIYLFGHIRVLGS